MDAYTEAHVFVAAVRVCEFKDGSAPKIETVCELLGYSVEHGHALLRKYTKEGILKSMEDPFSVRVSVDDYLKIENLSRQENEDNSLQKDLDAFNAKKKDRDAELASIQAKLDKKKKDMFADLEAKFKKEMGKDT